MVLSALESTELALESGLRHDQIIISCKTSRPRDLITVYRDLSAKTRQPLHLGLTEAGMGMKGHGVVAGVAGRAAVRRDRRYDPHFADAETGWRSPRRSVCVLRIAAGAGAAVLFAERDGVPGMRTDDEFDVPGIGGAHAGLHSRDDADVEAAVRRRGDDDAGGDGLHREWSRRIESREYRDQLAGNGRSAALPGVH